LSELRRRVKVVLLALRPTPPVLSATLPLKLAGTVLARKLLAAAGLVTVAVVGAVLSRVKLTAVPLKVLPTLSVAVAWMLKVPSASVAQVGRATLLVQAAVVPLVVALWVAARLKTADCQVEPFQ